MSDGEEGFEALPGRTRHSNASADFSGEGEEEVTAVEMVEAALSLFTPLTDADALVEWTGAIQPPPEAPRVVRRAMALTRDRQLRPSAPAAAPSGLDAPQEALLAACVVEGFGREEAAACARRVADAFGLVRLSDLGPGDALDLLLQALTEERLNPGQLFVRPSRALVPGAWGGSKGGPLRALWAWLTARRTRQRRAASAARPPAPAAREGEAVSATDVASALPALFVLALLLSAGSIHAAISTLPRMLTRPLPAGAPRCAAYSAAAAGDVAALATALLQPPPPSCGAGTQLRFATSLAVAVGSGHVTAAQQLLAAGAPPSAGWRAGHPSNPALSLRLSPLALAATAPLRAALLLNGAPVEAGLTLGHLLMASPLAFHARRGDADATAQLLTAGADPKRCVRLAGLWLPCWPIARGDARTALLPVASVSAPRAPRITAAPKPKPKPAPARPLPAPRRPTAPVPGNAGSSGQTAAAKAAEAAQAAQAAAARAAAAEAKAAEAEAAALRLSQELFPGLGEEDEF